MLPRPAIISCVISARPTGFLLVCMAAHSLSLSASSRNGSGPSLASHSLNKASLPISTVIALSSPTSPYSLFVRERRVVGVGSGPGRDVLTLKAPDMPKWMRTTTGSVLSFPATTLATSCCCFAPVGPSSCVAPPPPSSSSSSSIHTTSSTFRPSIIPLAFCWSEPLDLPLPPFLPRDCAGLAERGGGATALGLPLGGLLVWGTTGVCPVTCRVTGEAEGEAPPPKK
mmetsp:Transcript_7212/g.19340  ORF Transcript_7212/g.19340 Transcript_7212/m.19340 type:complete len:227 (-) Transcript_7212:348-1028(-)